MTTAYDPRKHPRGRPGNHGQFRAKDHCESDAGLADAVCQTGWGDDGLHAQPWKQLTPAESHALQQMSIGEAIETTNRLDAGPAHGFRGTPPERRVEILQQIGPGALGAISGMRSVPLPDGVDLPVDRGYRVRVRLKADDTYRVERIHRRGSKEVVKGARDGVYADEVSNAAYHASCFQSYDADEWPRRR